MAYKKSQAQQIFIYLLTLLIIGLMMFFGLKWVWQIVNIEDEINVAQFRVDLENSFDKIRPNYGSWKYEVFDIPKGINKVCFVEHSKYNDMKDDAGLCDPDNITAYDPVMCYAWENGDENVLFDSTVVDSLQIKNLKVEDGYLCLDVDSRKIRFKMRGLGDSVMVSD
ncbi:hypothetical protein JXB31_01285 [Candidatus Woesearchaeota archaeon]|nr:hypothetical protein [Candidatus Woesearchaeota archaeon]